jgi:hypothetical protein
MMDQPISWSYKTSRINLLTNIGINRECFKSRNNISLSQEEQDQIMTVN